MIGMAWPRRLKIWQKKAMQQAKARGAAGKKQAAAGTAAAKLQARAKTAGDVERVWLTSHKGRQVWIGGYAIGDVYIGRLKFRGEKKARRVAVKKFRRRISELRAAEIQRVINDLRKAGVKLPKMAMLRMQTKEQPQGEWVLVSQLFGATGKGSKIHPKSHFVIKTEVARAEAIKELAKVANAGYYPVGDLIEPFKKQWKGIIPIDLDTVAPIPPNMRTAYLMSAITNLSTSPEERKRLFEIALKTAKPEIREIMVKMRSEHKGLWGIADS